MRAEDETDTILDTAEGQAMTHLLNSQEWAGQNVLSRAGLIKRLEMMRDRAAEDMADGALHGRPDVVVDAEVDLARSLIAHRHHGAAARPTRRLAQKMSKEEGSQANRARAPGFRRSLTFPLRLR